jgi:hypothetical protein
MISPPSVYKYDIENLDEKGIRCAQCSKWEKGACFGFEVRVDREADAKICDWFEPDIFLEFF